MKIIIIHGDYTIKSYERLQRFIEVAKIRSWRVVKVSSSNKSIQETISAQELFDKKRFILVEDFDILNKKDLDWIKENKEKFDLTLVIYKKSKLSQTKLKSLGKIDKTEVYELPKLIWSFLDSFYPGNSRNCLKILHKVIENNPVEFVFALLARQMRDLYWSMQEGSSEKFPSWRLYKLRNQAKKFKDGQIKNIVGQLAEIDIKVKTSKANLKDELDFLIVTKLE